MNRHPAVSAFLRTTVASAALCGALLLPRPAAAQYPWVGITPYGSRLVAETISSPDGASAADRFGAATTTGDFNGDGAADLAVGIPGNDCVEGGATLPDCGMVMVRYGQRDLGLGSAVQYLALTGAGSIDAPQVADRFGAALAAGDFNADAFDDLAIGIPMSSLGHGRVVVHYGGPQGLTPAAIHLFEPGVTEHLPIGAGGLSGMSSFGASLAAGNFDADPYCDLAIGVPMYKVSNRSGAGGVVVLEGSLGGLFASDATSYFIGQEDDAIPDDPETNDNFGYSLAAGDFNKDSFADLVIGAPGEDSVGAMLVLFGSPNSLIFANNYWLGQFDLGFGSESGDLFALALAAGDFNGDGWADLATGIPGKNDFNGDLDVGLVALVYGAPGGMNFAATQWRDERTLGLVDNVGDRFGFSLATGDFDGDGFGDVAIGSPGENDGLGGVTILAGGSPLVSGRARIFQPGLEGVTPLPVVQQGSSSFAAALAAGDFDADGAADLVVGAPDMDFVANSEGGGFLFFGSTALFADGFEFGDTNAWFTGP